MEVIFEIVAEIYLEFAMALLPEGKQLHKAVKVILQILCAIISMAILLTLFCGIMMLVDPSFTEGDETTVSPWLLIGIGTGLILLQIFVAVLTHFKKKNK